MEFYAVNKDYPEEMREKNNHFSRKLKVDMWIDDRNIGGLPDWGTMYQMITQGLTWDDLMRQHTRDAGQVPPKRKKKHWWQFGS